MGFGAVVLILFFNVTKAAVNYTHSVILLPSSEGGSNHAPDTSKRYWSIRLVRPSHFIKYGGTNYNYPWPQWIWEDHNFKNDRSPIKKNRLSNIQNYPLQGLRSQIRQRRSSSSATASRSRIQRHQKIWSAHGHHKHDRRHPNANLHPP